MQVRDINRSSSSFLICMKDFSETTKIYGKNTSRPFQIIVLNTNLDIIACYIF